MVQEIFAPAASHAEWLKQGFNEAPFDEERLHQIHYRYQGFIHALNQLVTLDTTSVCVSHMHGESGAGKTTCLKSFYKMPSSYVQVYLPTAEGLSPINLLKTIYFHIHVKPEIVRKPCTEYIVNLAKTIARQDVKLRIIIDDAHTIPKKTLDVIQKLASVQPTGNHLQFLLASHHTVDSLNRDIVWDNFRVKNIPLPNLSQKETEKYIKLCLAQANQEIFQPQIPKETLNRIYQLSQGNIKRINQVASRHLLKHIQECKPAHKNPAKNNNLFAFSVPSVEPKNILKASAFLLLGYSLSTLYTTYQPIVFKSSQPNQVANLSDAQKLIMKNKLQNLSASQIIAQASSQAKEPKTLKPKSPKKPKQGPEKALLSSIASDEKTLEQLDSQVDKDLKDMIAPDISTGQQAHPDPIDTSTTTPSIQDKPVETEQPKDITPPTETAPETKNASDITAPEATSEPKNSEISASTTSEGAPLYETAEKEQASSQNTETPNKSENAIETSAESTTSAPQVDATSTETQSVNTEPKSSTTEARSTEGQGDSKEITSSTDLNETPKNNPVEKTEITTKPEDKDLSAENKTETPANKSQEATKTEVSEEQNTSTSEIETQEAPSKENTSDTKNAITPEEKTSDTANPSPQENPPKKEEGNPSESSTEEKSEASNTSNTQSQGESKATEALESAPSPAKQQAKLETPTPFNGQSGFIVQLATHSLAETRQKFCSRFNICSEKLVDYTVTKPSKTQRVFALGPFETKSQASEAIQKLPRGLMVGKPWIRTVSTVIKEYERLNSHTK